MRGGQQVVGTMAVFQAKERVAVFVPATGFFVWFTWQECRKVDLMCPGGRHFFTDNALKPLFHAQPQREPGKDARRLTSNVTGPNKQFVAGYFSVSRVFSKRAKKVIAETCKHALYRIAPGCSSRCVSLQQALAAPNCKRLAACDGDRWFA